VLLVLPTVEAWRMPAHAGAEVAARRTRVAVPPEPDGRSGR
jgi:hypothetical protein